jgi:ribosomal protein L37E
VDETMLPQRAKEILVRRLKTYEMVPTTTGHAIRCRVCGMTSHNPNDVKHRYCGHCHAFHDDWERFHRLEVAERARLTEARAKALGVMDP